MRLSLIATTTGSVWMESPENYGFQREGQKTRDFRNCAKNHVVVTSVLVDGLDNHGSENHVLTTSLSIEYQSPGYPQPHDCNNNTPFNNNNKIG